MFCFISPSLLGFLLHISGQFTKVWIEVSLALFKPRQLSFKQLLSRAAVKVDLGVGREGLGHPFFFEILCYFYRILRKVKSIYIAGKCLGHPFLNSLDPRMSVTYVFGILHFVPLVSRFTF